MYFYYLWYKAQHWQHQDRIKFIGQIWPKILNFGLEISEGPYFVTIFDQVYANCIVGNEIDSENIFTAICHCQNFRLDSS